jgi:hypothetical protein
MKHTRAALLAGMTLTAASVGAFVPAHAADTTTTFTLTGGSLTISAPAAADLGSAAAGAATVSGNLGDVTVTDDRGALVAVWNATVQSSDFAHDTDSSFDIAATAVNYTPGVPTGSGAVFTPGVGGLLGGALPLPAVTAAGVGNNTATWDPTVTVSLPAQSVVGTYTGTITHSVS